jgi:PKD repeat protein
LRRLAGTVLAVVALLAPASATAADAPITLDDNGFSPTEVVIKPGDSVTFTNNSALGVERVQFSDEAGVRCEGLLPSDCTRSNFPAGLFTFFDPAHTGCADYPTCADPYRGVVIVDGPPQASALSGPASGLRGQAVPFSAGGTDPNGDAITSFNWDFGDGQTAATPTGEAQHAYGTVGHYTITLTVTDSRGNVSTPVQAGIDIAVPDSDGDGVNDDDDRCSLIPGTGPDGCLPVPAVIVPPPLLVGATTAKQVGLAATLQSGVTVVVTCSDSCVADLTVLPDLGTASVGIPGGGSRVVTVAFTPAAKSALRKAGDTKLRIKAVITDAEGRTLTRLTTITLKPVPAAVRPPVIGISDQQPTTFGEPLFQVLRLRFARYVTPWNSISREPGRLDAWLRAAKAQGVRPLVSFEHARGDACPSKPCKAPTVARYRKAWRAFHKKYPWVKDISPWNEVNSQTQPTGKRPDLAAAYYNVVRASCPRCAVVAADVLDTNNMVGYITAFRASAKGTPRLWGLHNYRDTNRFRELGTRRLLASVPGTIWFTETGGIVKFTTQRGKKALPFSESRAKRAMDYVFRLAAIAPRRIKRVYVYQWKVNFKADRFDAGVVRPDGTPRPSFHVLTLHASVATAAHSK